LPSLVVVTYIFLPIQADMESSTCVPCILIKICIYTVHVNDCRLIKSKHAAVEYI